MLKMVMVVYNEAIESDIVEALEKDCAMKSYTKIPGVFGRGSTSGTHLGNDIWPGRNNILYVACEEKQAKQIIACVRSLKSKLGHEGIKAFLLALEEAT
jgi:hypothetical protein